MGRKVRTIQTNFTSGEIDPLLAARTDVKHYYNGLDKARNVLGVPQGPIGRRPGLKYLDQICP